MKIWNSIVLNYMGSGGIALFSHPGELNSSVPNLFATALGNLSSEKKNAFRSALADPDLLGWARDMGKLVISYMPLSPETADANMKAFSEALPVLMKPLAHMPEEIEFDAWYTYSTTKHVPVPQFWSDAYGKETWTPTAVYIYAFLLRREADQKDAALKNDTVSAWQELIRAWGDALGARIMNKTWVVEQPPSKSKTIPVSVSK